MEESNHVSGSEAWHDFHHDNADAGQAAAASAAERTEPNMKPARLYVALLALLLIGCTAEVGQQLLAQRRTFNTTLQTIHAAHVAGLLPAAQEKQAVPYLEAVKASLDAADASYAAGDKATADVYSRASLAGLEKLRTILATTQPTTKPVK